MACREFLNCRLKPQQTNVEQTAYRQKAQDYIINEEALASQKDSDDMLDEDLPATLDHIGL